MGASVYDFSTTPASNTTIDSISQAENVMRPPAVNNAFRALDAIIARFVDDLGGVNTVGGTGDAITVTLASGITAYATGQIFRFKASAANTTNVTLNVNSIGAKAVRKISGGTDVALIANDLLPGVMYEVIYDTAANSAAGAWIVVNPLTAQVYSWTPVLTFATPGNLSVSYSSQIARAVKSGSTMTLFFSIITSAFTHTTASGNLQITGSAIAPLDTGLAKGVVAWAGFAMPGSRTQLAVSAASTGTLLFLASGSGSSRTFVTAADVPTGGTVVLEGSITYPL